MTAWTGAQVLALIEELPEHLKAIAYLGAACGHRKGELFGTAVEDQDFLRKTVHVEWQTKYLRGKCYFARTKNNSVRDVPVADPAVIAVAEHLRVFPAVEVTMRVMNRDGTIGKPITRRLIFTQPDGRAHNMNSFAWWCDKARKDAGIPHTPHGTGMHVLRHTAASEWLSNGLSLAMVAAHHGDTKRTVLDIYAHFMPADESRATVIMNRFLAPPAEESAQNVPPEISGQV